MKKTNIYTQYDFFYNSVFFLKFLNRLMRGGKRSIIEKIIYGLLKNLNFIDIFYIKNIYKINYLPIFFFFEVLSICRPLLSARIFKPSKKSKNGRKRTKKDIAINTKIIPIPISRKKSYSIAIGWVISVIKFRREIDLESKVKNEFKDIVILKKSQSLVKKKQLYKLLTLNRSSLHFR